MGLGVRVCARVHRGWVCHVERCTETLAPSAPSSYAQTEGVCVCPCVRVCARTQLPGRERV